MQYNQFIECEMFLRRFFKKDQKPKKSDENCNEKECMFKFVMYIYKKTLKGLYRKV